MSDVIHITKEKLSNCEHIWEIISESHDSTHDATLKKCNKCKVYWSSIGSIYGNSEEFYYNKKELRKLKLDKINE